MHNTYWRTFAETLNRISPVYENIFHDFTCPNGKIYEGKDLTL